MNFDIPNLVQFIIKKLENKGYEAYIVGGCVRDNILSRVPHDYDICTSATPNEIVHVFPCDEIIPTGIKHGTVTLLIDNEPFEITTYRIDGKYSDNRRPDDVKFTDNINEDLMRRDFTINSMAYNPINGLVDPFNGLDDIQNKIIRCVGSAKDRFNEDALRILRAIRFASQLDFIISQETNDEIHRQYENLKNISVERINSEFCKIVMSNSFHIQLSAYSDVFSLFIPELECMIGFDQNNPYHAYDVYNHTIKAIENCDSDDLIVRLAVFFHDFGKPHCYQDDPVYGIRHFKGHGKLSSDMTNEVMRHLRFDNDTRNKVVELVYYHDATFEVDKKHIRRWLNKIGEEQFRRLLEVRKADIKGQSPDYETERIQKVMDVEVLLDQVLLDQACFSLKDLKINGNDVKVVMNIEEGEGIGLWLNNILNHVINGDINNNRDDLINYMADCYCNPTKL